MDKWAIEHKEFQKQLHIEVRFQINGEYLPHLIENDVAISYSPGEKTGYLTHAFG